MTATARMLLAWLLLLPCTAALAATDNLETRVKAAFLFKFCNYIEWPRDTFSSAEAPLVIAVMGADSLAGELQLAVMDRQINGRAVIVRQLRPDDSLEGVHVLFIGGKGAGQRHTAVSTKLPILTVTENEHPAATGMINFVVVNDRVRFDIARDRAEQAGLKLSSLLLSVARRVQTGVPL
ncbi:YfiR family protein [Porticoccus sp.]